MDKGSSALNHETYGNSSVRKRRRECSHGPSTACLCVPGDNRAEVLKRIKHPIELSLEYDRDAGKPTPVAGDRESVEVASSFLLGVRTLSPDKNRQRELGFSRFGR